MKVKLTPHNNDLNRNWVTHVLGWQFTSDDEVKIPGPHRERDLAGIKVTIHADDDALHGGALTVEILDEEGA